MHIGTWDHSPIAIGTTGRAGTTGISCFVAAIAWWNARGTTCHDATLMGCLAACALEPFSPKWILNSFLCEICRGVVNSRLGLLFLLLLLSQMYRIWFKGLGLRCSWQRCFHYPNLVNPLCEYKGSHCLDSLHFRQSRLMRFSTDLPGEHQLVFDAESLDVIRVLWNLYGSFSETRKNHVASSGQANYKKSLLDGSSSVEVVTWVIPSIQNQNQVWAKPNFA